MKKLVISLLFILVSCVEDNLTPETALKTFVEGRMGKSVSRDFVLERVSGKMLQTFQNITDEEFQKFGDLRHIEKSSFKILSKSCQEKKCFLTYSLSYRTGKEFSTEVKKIAELVAVEGKWLIEDVSNIKTYHESLEPINPLE